MTDQGLPRIGVFLAVDGAIARQGANLIISKQADMEVVGQSDSAGVLSSANDMLPRTVVVLHALPPKTVFELVSRLAEVSPEVSVIVVNEVENDEAVFQAALAGASAFMTKGSSSAQFLDAIRRAHAGGRPIVASLFGRSGVASRVLARFGEVAAMASGLGPLVASLSPTEAELLKRVAGGAPAAQVAAALGVSQAALLDHGLSILRKMKVNEHTRHTVAALYGLEPRVTSVAEDRELEKG